LSVCDGATKKTEGSAPAVAPASDLQPAGSGHFGKIKFFCPELDHINKCAYSDYQREKIYLRTSAAVRKSLHRKRRASKKKLKVNQEVLFPRPEVCPECGSVEIQKHESKNARKVVTDLKFTPSGVKRWCVRLRSPRFICLRCRKTFLAQGYRAMKSRLGSNLCSWAIYHHVSLRQSSQDVAFSLNDIFGYSFDRALLSHITPMVADQYRITFQRLKDKLRNGPLIHGDETKGVVKGHSGYVWTFTN